eukprot:PhM_4_TR13670/c2_g1_i2/m.19346
MAYGLFTTCYFVVALVLLLLLCSVANASLYLDGTGWYQAPLSAVAWSDGSGVTVDTWVRLDAVTSKKQAVLCLGESSSSHLCVAVEGGVWAVSTRNDTSPSASPISAKLFTWMHLAVVASTSGAKVYVDGALATTVTSGLQDTSASVVRVGATFINAFAMKGSIDLFRVWSVPLSAVEVSRYRSRSIASNASCTETVFPTPMCNATASDIVGLSGDRTAATLFSGSPPISSATAWFPFDAGLETANIIQSSPFFTSCVLSPTTVDYNNTKVSPFPVAYNGTRGFMPRPSVELPVAQYCVALPGNGTNRIRFDNFRMPATFSVEFWFKPSSTKRATLLASSSSSLQFTAMGIWYTSGGMTEVFDADVSTMTGWTHMAFQLDATKQTGTLYVNGVLVEVRQQCPDWSGSDLEIGAQPESEKYLFEGMVDELVVYNYPRTGLDIRGSMGSKVDMKDVPLGLVHYVPFAEGVGNTTEDVITHMQGTIRGAISAFTPQSPIQDIAAAQYTMTCPGNGFVPHNTFVLSVQIMAPAAKNITRGVILSRASSTGGFTLSVDDNVRLVLEFPSPDGAARQYVAPSPLPRDKWSLVTVVADALCPTNIRTRVILGTTTIMTVPDTPSKVSAATPLVLGGTPGFSGVLDDVTFSTIHDTDYDDDIDVTPAPPTLRPSTPSTTVPTLYGLAGCPQRSPTGHFTGACGAVDSSRLSLTLAGLNFGDAPCPEAANSTLGNSTCIVFQVAEGVEGNSTSLPYCSKVVWSSKRVVCPTGFFHYPADIPSNTTYNVTLRTEQGLVTLFSEATLHTSALAPLVRSVRGCAQSNDGETDALGCISGADITIGGSLFPKDAPPGTLNVTFETPDGARDVNGVLTCEVLSVTYSTVVCTLDGMEMALANYDAPYTVRLYFNELVSSLNDVTVSPHLGTPVVKSVEGCASTVGGKIALGCRRGDIITLSGANFGELPEFAEPTQHIVKLASIRGSNSQMYCSVMHWGATEIVCGIGHTSSTSGEFVVTVVSFGRASENKDVFVMGAVEPPSQPVMASLDPATCFSASEGTATNIAGALGSNVAWTASASGTASVTADLRQTYDVYHLATSSAAGALTTTYEISYSTDNENFVVYRQVQQVRGEVTVASFVPPLRARAIRLTPKSSEGTPSLNMELFVSVPQKSCAGWRRQGLMSDGSYLISTASAPAFVHCHMDFYDYAWTIVMSEWAPEDTIGAAPSPSVVATQRLYTTPTKSGRLSAAMMRTVASQSQAAMVASVVETAAGVTLVNAGKYFLTKNSRTIANFTSGHCLSDDLVVSDWEGTRARAPYLHDVNTTTCTLAVSLMAIEGSVNVSLVGSSQWSPDVPATAMQVMFGERIRFPARYFAMRVEVNLDAFSVEAFRNDIAKLLELVNTYAVTIERVTPTADADNRVDVVLGINVDEAEPDTLMELVRLKAEGNDDRLLDLGVETVQLMSSSNTTTGPLYRISPTVLGIFEEFGWKESLLLIAFIIIFVAAVYATRAWFKRNPVSTSSPDPVPSPRPEGHIALGDEPNDEYVVDDDDKKEDDDNNNNNNNNNTEQLPAFAPFSSIAMASSIAIPPTTSFNPGDELTDAIEQLVAADKARVRRGDTPTQSSHSLMPHIAIIQSLLGDNTVRSLTQRIECMTTFMTEKVAAVMNDAKADIERLQGEIDRLRVVKPSTLKRGTATPEQIMSGSNSPSKVSFTSNATIANFMNVEASKANHMPDDAALAASVVPKGTLPKSGSVGDIPTSGDEDATTTTSPNTPALPSAERQHMTAVVSMGNLLDTVTAHPNYDVSLLLRKHSLRGGGTPAPMSASWGSAAAAGGGGGAVKPALPSKKPYRVPGSWDPNSPNAPHFFDGGRVFSHTLAAAH